MTEKPVKTNKLKNKKAFKAKNVAVPPKRSANSDDSNDSSNELSPQQKKAIEQKADKQEKEISSEVTNLLATLKKQHGIKDEPVAVKAPKNKNEKSGENVKKDKKKAKINGKVAVKENNVAIPKATIIDANADSQVKSKKQKNQKNKNAKQNDVGQKQAEVKAENTNETEATNNDSPAKKKNKNKKRKADNQSNAANEGATPTKKVKKEQKQKQNEKVEKVEAAASEENEEETETGDGEKKDYYLKNAFPVFVGNLPTNTKHKRLMNMFKRFGKVLAIRLRTNTGKSFMKKKQIEKVPFLTAFIYFETKAAAESSLSLNGEKFNENTIKVDMDTKDITKKVNPKTTVMVGNLKYAVTDEILKKTFDCCGSIEYIKVMQTDKGCKGTAFVCFKKEESAALALELNGTEVLEREIRVEKFRSKKLTAPKEKKDKKLQKAGIENKGKKVQAANKPNKGNKPGGDGKKDKDGKQKKFKGAKNAKKEFVGEKSSEKKKKPKKMKKMSPQKKLALKVAPKAKKADKPSPA